MINNGDLSDEYSTTGFFRDSWRKTNFNRATGLRQQQGIVGFAANLGYASSGVGLALLLGNLAKGLKKAGDAALEFAKQSTEAYGEIQSIKTNLGIVYGSQAQADSTFNEIAQYSVKSPFGVQTVSEYAVLLKQSGIYASDLMNTLKQIGDVAGGNQQKFANIANSFSQIEANGKATTRQLRQFATAGIPIYKELMKAYEQVNGKTISIDQVRKLTESGKITADIIEKAFSNMTSAGGTFENAVNIGAKTWRARQQNLADARQLAQSQFGEWMLNLGGTGRGDSWAYRWTELKENLYGLIENTAEVVNINKSVKNIEKQNSIVAKLQEQYNLLKAAGASDETLERILKKIREENEVIEPDKVRSTYKTAYDLAYIDIKGKEQISDDEYNQLKDLASTSLASYQKMANGDYMRWVQKESGARGYGVAEYISSEEYGKLASAVEDAKTRLEKVIPDSFVADFNNKVADYFQGAMIAYADQFFSNAEDALDRAINRNPLGIGAQRQKSQTEYLSSSLGQREEKIKTINERQNAIDNFNEYSKLINENGNLLLDFKGSIKYAVDLYQSGIIVPMERLSITPEKLSNDIKYVRGEEDRESREENWNTFKKNVEEQVAALMGSSSIIEQNLMRELVSSFYNVTAMGLVSKDNSYENVAYVGEVFGKVLTELEKIGSSDLVSLLAQTSTVKTVGDSPKIINETVPLWQRILNQSFGTDLSLFKNGAITRGDQAVNIWNTQQQRTGIASMARAMMNTMSYKDVLGNLAGVNGDPRNKNYVIGNTSNNGVSQIDWKQTYKNFSDFAMSMESATSVTQAYVDSLTTDTDTLKDFMTQAFTITEDPANVYDLDYRKQLGNLADNIKALDANAYDMMFKRDENGEIIGLRENAAEAARALLEEKNTMLAFADAVATAKTEIDNMNQQIRSLTLTTDINLGRYADSQKFAGVRKEDVNTVMTFFDEEMNKDIWKNLINKSGLSLENIKESYINGTVLDVSSEVNDKAKIDATKRLETLQKQYEDTLKAASERFVKIMNDKNTEKWKSWGGDTEARRKFVTESVLTDPSSTEFSPAAIAAKKTLDEERESLQKIINASDISFNDLYEALDKLLDKVKQVREETDRAAYSEGWDNLVSKNVGEGLEQQNRWHSVLFGYDTYGNNNLKQQQVLDYMGLPAGTSFNSFKNSLFGEKYDSKNRNSLIDFITGFSEKDLDFTGTKGTLSQESLNFLENMFSQGDGEDSLEKRKQDISDLLDFGTESSKNELIDFFMNLQYQIESTRDVMKDLGTTMRDTLLNSTLKGLDNTMVKIGNGVRLQKENLYDAEEAAKGYADIWKDVAQEMLSSIGPAATQAGLALITQGNVRAGMLLLGAGGILNIMSGMFNDDEVDKKKQEEERLKSLKDLLADLIEQAKKDAEYYEKNFRHQNALSQSNEISVNDAIIAPNGNVISTAPDDYLIATKTPGSLVGSGAANVNFTFIDQSTGAKSVDVEKKQNPDGSVDIIATIVDVVSNAVADGTMDTAFEARDYRINGKSYAY